MIEFAQRPQADRSAYFQEAANRRGLTRLIVEKDFWVCFLLRLVFNAPFRNHLVFKGGTSLSKVFGIIDRFSEDIDLSLNPGWLGFGGENQPDAAESRSQFDRRQKKLQKACIAAVDGTIRSTLEQELRAILGTPISNDSHLIFEIDSQTHSPVLIFRYPTNERAKHQYIRPEVKLELGSLTDQRPTGEHQVRPWLAEEFPELFTHATASVVALEAERTFWEKATILHAEFHRPKERPMRTRLSRDCYDLYRMADHRSGQLALTNMALLEQVVEHKQTYFRSSWAHFELARPGTFHVVPPEHRMMALRSDYRAMRDMFHHEPPPFDDLLARLREIELRINES